jgi:hypothetical protein
MLHTGAVEIAGKAFLFAAPSYGGKSTLTHYFVNKGHRLLSDDTLAFFKRGKGYYAIPSYPYIRNYRKVEDLGKYVDNFSTVSLPIGAIYRLIQAGECTDIHIRETKGVHKFSIVEMCRNMRLPIEKDEHLSGWVKFVRNTPIYEISVPQDMDRLKEVYHRITEHVESDLIL